jgi:glutamine synthetase
MGIEPEKVRSENGSGQIEFNTRFGTPLQAVEQHWRFKQAFRQLARRHGYVGTFMPKPFPHLQGSGLHLHIGVTGAAGRDLFYDAADPRGLELSRVGYGFLGGLLAHVGAIVALGSPSVNSYKRLQPGTWAPAHRGFAAGNRSVLVRVVESRPHAPGGVGAKRLELRSPDGTCNPYLLAIAVLAAGLDGVRRELDPGQDLTGHDTALLSADERDRLGAPDLPRTLDQALDALEADPIVAEALGTTIYESFLAAKRSEVLSYQADVSEWEYAHYLERF